jgi:hypothetical protein
VGFEFHEDIAEVDAKGDTKASFAGKMHVNLRKFDKLAEKIVFVSNQPLTEARGASGELSFDKAEAKARTKFLDAIKVEIPGFSEKDDLGRFRFLDCGLHLDTYDRTVIGQIALFLANEIGGDVDGKQFYLTLGFQCRERSKKFADLTSVQQLVGSKFVTREAVTADLDRLRAGRVRRPKWDDIASRFR